MKKKMSIDELDERRISETVNRGTIYLKSYEEFVFLSDYFNGQLVKPIHAAKMLNVSRALIFQLEKEGKIRAYRMIFDDEVWKTIPAHLRLFVTRSDVYIWIPIEDIERYADGKGKKLKKVRSHYLNEFHG